MTFLHISNLLLLFAWCSISRTDILWDCCFVTAHNSSLFLNFSFHRHTRKNLLTFKRWSWIVCMLPCSWLLKHWNICHLRLRKDVSSQKHTSNKIFPFILWNKHRICNNAIWNKSYLSVPFTTYFIAYLQASASTSNALRQTSCLKIWANENHIVQVTSLAIIIAIQASL